MRAVRQRWMIAGGLCVLMGVLAVAAADGSMAAGGSVAGGGFAAGGRLAERGSSVLAGGAARAPSAGPKPSVVAIAGGGFAGYELLSNRRVWAWGDDLEGQIGTAGAWQVSTAPVEVRGLAGVAAVAAGENTAYALERDGAVWAWGDDSQDELGDAGASVRRETPLRVRVPSAVIALAAGGWSAYALRRSGTVWAWGDDGWGQLGSAGGNAARGTPRPVRQLNDVMAIAAGAGDGYALRRDGTVWAWGEGILGQLGDGCTVSKLPLPRGSPCQATSVPTKVRTLRDVVAIAAGAFTTYALRRDGTVWAWGDNSFGELGSHSGRALAGAPVRVSGLEHVVAIAAGSYSGYALLRDGTVWAWGRGVDGELGDGSAVNRDAPTRVLKLTGVAKLAGGGDMAYALDERGRLWAWGSGVYGQLGDGYLQDLDEATPVLETGIA